MVSSPVVDKVWSLAKLAAQQNGCELYDVEFIGSQHGRVLRVYIEKEGGVSIANCEAVSRTMNLHLDAEDPVAGGAYNLEVSSPGLDRTLRRPEHFQTAIDKEVQLKTRNPLSENNQRQFKGKIAGVTEATVELDLGDKKVSIPFENVEKAKIIFNFGTNSKPNKK